MTSEHLHSETPTLEHRFPDPDSHPEFDFASHVGHLTKQVATYPEQLRILKIFSPMAH